MANPLPRQRLWQQLDAAGSAGLIWMQAPGGSGKTVAVAGWLKDRGLRPVWYRTDAGDSDPATMLDCLARALPAEFASSLPVLSGQARAQLSAFALRWFERWWERLVATGPAPHVLVFDDYQEAGEEGAHHELLRCALERMPADARIVVLSRGRPPAAWARLRAGGQLHHLLPEDVALQEDEAMALAGHRAPSWPTPALQAVSRACGGWAAGLVLLTQSGPERWSTPQADGIGVALQEAAVHDEGLLDYFVHEVIGNVPPDRMPVLRAAAWLPVVYVDVVQALTGRTDAAEVLDDLHRSGTFTLRIDRAGEQSQAYQFHPLFQASLRSPGVQGADVGATEAARREASVALALQGHLEDAVVVSLAVRHWALAAAQLRELRPHLFEQGRHQTLRRWLDELPESLIEADPWLLFGRGDSRCQLMDHERGLPDLHRACDGFERQDDHDALARGLFVLAHSILSQPGSNPGDLHVLFDRLLGLERRWAGSSGGRLLLLAALSDTRWCSQPDDPRLDGWLQELRGLAQATGTAQAMALWLRPELQIGMARGAARRVAAALQVLEEVEPGLQAGSRLRMYGRLLRVQALIHLGRFEQAHEAHEAAVAAALAEGAVVWLDQLMLQGVLAALCRGHVGLAQSRLEEVQRRWPVQRGAAALQQRQVAACVALAAGDLPRARSEAQAQQELLPTSDLAVFRATVPLTLAWVLQAADGAADGAPLGTDAAQLARQALQAARAIGAAALESDARLCLAAMAGGPEASEDLGAALALARELGVHGPLGARAQDLSALMSRALDLGIEVEHVRQCIRVRGLPPPPDLPVNWCWPLRIRTLGPLSIERELDGAVQPLRFGPKAPRKLLQLLKAVIALRAEAVGEPVAEVRVLDAVWPELEADQAQAALKMALSRLNALLGEPGGWLVQRAGQVMLDTSRVWVDVHALQRRLKTAEDAPIILDLYRGPFLFADLEEAWSLGPREHWRQQVVQWLDAQAAAAERDDRADEALRLCMAGLQADAAAEPLAVRAMRLQGRLGSRLEGLATYERLKEALGRELGLRPCAAAQALHRELLQG